MKTGQKQVRNRSETGQKHQKGSACLASHPSIHPSTSALIIATTTTTPATTTTATTTATTATTTTTPTPTSTPTPTPTPNATSLSLSLAYSLTLLPELLRLLLFQFPLPLLLVLLLLPVHCEFSGPFPDRTSLFCSQIWNRRSLLSLLDLLLPPALPPHPLLLHHPAPPLPLVHLGISALAFKSNCTRVKGQKRVRNQSETSQKPVRNRPNAISLSPLPIPSPSHQNSYAYSYCNFHYHYC